MRVLVTGGCGFIGSHLVDELVASGHSLCVMSRTPERCRPPVAGVEYRFADLADTAALTDALQGCDAVAHLISTTFPATAEADPVADVEGNLVGTLRLLQAMRATGVKRLLYLSSGGAIYGVPAVLPIPETHALNPIGSYGIVKAAIERYVAVAAAWGLTAAVLRPSNAYGPRQTVAANPGFVGTALRNLAEDRPLRIFGDGRVVRDYLHVRDLASLCRLALEGTETLTLNAGSGIGRSLLEVCSAIEKVTGRALQVEFLPGRSIDVPVSILDCEAARRRLNWTARTAFEDGLAETWDWVRSQGP